MRYEFYKLKLDFLLKFFYKKQGGTLISICFTLTKVSLKIILKKEKNP